MISISKRSIGNLEGDGFKSLYKNLKPAMD
jgi:hypothetical protein